MVLVVYVFLQGWRATLIPLLAVPVSLIGTFMVFPLLGFSINTLSLFGLVLAIGLVVDDAIVVVEAVERHIEEGMTPRDAALKAMEEVSGPVIAIALILAAVFVPTVFIPGITGRLYQQFAVTIAISVLFSAFNALSLSPALCGPAAEAAARNATGRWACFSAGSIASSGARTETLRRHLGAPDPQGRAGARCSWRRIAVVAVAARQAAAASLPARRRPGLRLLPPATAQRRLAAADHRGGRAKWKRSSATRRACEGCTRSSASAC